MNTDDKLKIFPTYIKWIRIFFGAALLILLPFLIIGQFVYPDERDALYEDYKEFQADWYRVLENGERVSVEVPGKVPAERGEVVTLVTTLPDNIYDRETLCFRTIWQDVEIYIDGELRESYNTRDSRPFGTNSAFRYVFVDLKRSDAGKELTYQFSSDSKYAGFTRTSYIGDRASIWFLLIGKSGARTIIALFLLLLTFFCIVVCWILKYVYKKNLPLNYLAWAIFFCALWMLSEIEFRQIILKNVSVLTNYTYWSLMLVPFPMMLYVNEVQGGRYQKIYFLPSVYAAGMLVVGTLLQVFNVVQFVQQLPFIHVATAAAMLCIIVTITIDTIKRQISDYIFVGIGLYGMLFTAVIEIILYYIGTNLSLGTVLAVGLLFLLIMAIVKTGQDYFKNEKIRQKAISAKDAQAKFLASMSHEIRTPINAVIGMNEMILRENENDTIQEYAYNIQRASNMLLELVNDVLDFSKIESGKLELVNDTYDLASLIQDEILIMQVRAKEKPIEVQIDINPSLPSKLFGDEMRIKQVLTNLISNAVKYTKEGKVTLQAFCQWINEDTVNLGFSIIDTGLGIKEEDLPHLFDSYKRLELSKNHNIQGTGLGLNIVKNLVELMQGNIYVKSEYGKGSTFSIFIPQKVVDRHPIGNMEETTHKQKKELAGYVTAPDATMLIVDDNSMNLIVVQELLKRTEIKLELAKSGKECLELTKQKNYDIILLDHMMPEMDGIETLQKIRADHSNLNQNTIVIALTANAVAGCRQMYLENGFDDYISKPIQVDVLDKLLLEYLPKQYIQMKGVPVTEKEAVTEQEEDLFYIDRNMGLYYCKNSEEFYKDILSVFCEQCSSYLSELDVRLKNREWERYAVVSYELKTNALNIGATNFSELCLQHETAGREKNAAFIEADYNNYVTAIRKLLQVIVGML